MTQVLVELEKVLEVIQEFEVVEAEACVSHTCDDCEPLLAIFVASF